MPHIIKMEGAVKSYEPNLCPREARQFIQIGRYGISINLPNDNVKYSHFIRNNFTLDSNRRAISSK